jgi:signal transduction histidine kinase
MKHDNLLKESDAHRHLFGIADFDLVLLANFVHQVINPLNGVAGTLDNLAEGVIREEHRREQRLRATRAQVEQCITLMRNLAFLAHGFGKLPDRDRKIVVLPQVIIESAMFFQEEGKRKGIEIHLNDRQTQNRVSGHPELIRQVLMNIFDNCVKYSDNDTTVEVDQRIQKKTNSALISVRNRSKLPMDVTEAQKIFELGFRGGNARGVIASGTGLGMYISKRIVEDVHEGSLKVQVSRQRQFELTIKLPHAEVP